MTNENTSYPERFSDDPQENLRIENELLRMRLQAQFGGVSAAGDNVSPEEENLFLRHVLAFEEQYSNAPLKKVHEILGFPVFEKAEALDDLAIHRELDRITELFIDHGIELQFVNEYDARFKYQFIVDEFFEFEIEDIKVPDMVNCFLYEEFHPDQEESSPI